MIADAYDGGWEESAVAGVGGDSSVAGDTAASSRSDRPRSAASTPPSTVPPTSDDGMHGFWKSPRTTPSRGSAEPHRQHKTDDGVQCPPSTRGDADGHVTGAGIRAGGVKHARPSGPDRFDRRQDGRGHKRPCLGAAGSSFAEVGGGDAQRCEVPVDEDVTIVDLAKVPRSKRRGQILELDSNGGWRDTSPALVPPQNLRRAGQSGTDGLIRGIWDGGQDGQAPAVAPASGDIFAMLRTHRVKMTELFGSRCVVCKVVDGDGDVGHDSTQCPRTQRVGWGAATTPGRAGRQTPGRMIADNGRVARDTGVKVAVGCCWGCFRVQPKDKNSNSMEAFGCRGWKRGPQWPCDERGENVQGFDAVAGKGLSRVVVAWVALLATRPRSASEEALRRLDATDDIIGKLRRDNWWVDRDVGQWALESVAAGWSSNRKQEVRTWMSREMGFYPNDWKGVLGLTRMGLFVSELL